MLFRKSQFFIHENLDFSLIGLSMGNRIVKRTGFTEVEKSFSAGILLGFNAGLCAGYVDEDLGVGVNYTLIGGASATDLEYNFNITNRGLLELRLKVGPLMGQIGHSFNYKTNRIWNGMLAFWFGDDPDTATMNLFLKAENNTTLRGSLTTKINLYSIGMTITY
ncbi:MAG: hypothetical protein NZ455_07420 [Bacteroidia bacterium]|nr:hypothetical protein [Bacteroidia bacterium]